MKIKFEFKDEYQKGWWHATLWYGFLAVVTIITFNIDNWIRWWTR